VRDFRAADAGARFEQVSNARLFLKRSQRWRVVDTQFCHGLIQVNMSLSNMDAVEGAQEAFPDRVTHVSRLDVPPLGDDGTVIDNHYGSRADLLEILPGLS
jgi:hypothetical protein